MYTHRITSLTGVSPTARPTSPSYTNRPGLCSLPRRCAECSPAHRFCTFMRLL